MTLLPADNELSNYITFYNARTQILTLSQLINFIDQCLFDPLKRLLNMELDANWSHTSREITNQR